MRYLVFIIALFAALQTNAQNNIVYGAGINYTNGAPTFTPPVRTSRVVIDTVTGKWYHFNTPGGWQLIGNTIEEIAGCTAPAYTPGKGDSKVVINNCSPQPELYFYNGSAWVLVGGGSVYAGEGIRIENDTIILDSLYVLRFRTGDTTDLNAGAVSWNAGEQTLDVVINQGAVTGQMFQEVLYFTKNQTGAQINDGTVVMAAGTTGNSGKILIAPAIADGSVNSEYILGLATQNLPNGGEGMVTHFGKVRGIQTNGANYGETWVDGDVLYCSAVTPGYLTKVLPTAPNLKIPIAIVIHAHPSNGTLFVRPSHFPDLAQINDVQLTSPTNGQVLTYNSTLSRWENATPANQLQTLSTDGSAGNISISSGNTITLNVNDADASATNELQTISTGTNTLTLSNGGGTVTVDTDPTNDVTGSGTSGQVSFWAGTSSISGSSSFTWDNSTNKLKVRTGQGTGYLDIGFTGGATNFPTSYGEEVFSITSSTGWGRHFIKQWNNTTTQRRGISLGGTNNAGTEINNILVVSPFPSGRVAVNKDVSQSLAYSFEVASGSDTDGIVLTRADDVNDIVMLNANSDGDGILRSKSGYWTLGDIDVNLNNQNPNTILHLFGPTGAGRSGILALEKAAGFGAALLNINYGNTYYPNGKSLEFDVTNIPLLVLATDNNGLEGEVIFPSGKLGVSTSSPAARLHVVGSGTSSSTWTAQFHNASTGGNNALMIRDDGNVGIGTNAPTFRFDVSSSIQNSFRVVNTGPMDVLFQVPTNNQIAYNFAQGAAYQMAFALNTNGNGEVRMNTKDFTVRQHTGASTGIVNLYCRSTGGAAVGTSSMNASAAFQVESTTGGILFPRMTTTERNAIATPADGLVIYNTTDNKLQVRAGGAWADLH